MKLSISNIAWDNTKDEEMYQYLQMSGFDAIEIAPTRFLQNPYENIEEAVRITDNIKDKYNLEVSSMQSIWYGRSENIFGSEEDRKNLIQYTEKAVLYAKAINCKNLVFGCPKNRNMEDTKNINLAYEFFGTIASLAEKNGVVIALEPNPVIYNTNFINFTEEAFNFVKDINSKGFMINLDLGTVIYNNEDITKIIENISLIHHIHISEPNLVIIKKRELHHSLKELLVENKYDQYISIEMKNLNDIEIVKQTVNYINEVMR